jgi:deoxyribodipyrimidine photo-lyase
LGLRASANAAGRAEARFNPIAQGEKFDPNGDYVRKYVSELRGVQGKAVHKLGTLPEDYPAPVVDHNRERRVSLDRYEAVRTS